MVDVCSAPLVDVDGCDDRAEPEGKRGVRGQRQRLQLMGRVSGDEEVDDAVHRRADEGQTGACVYWGGREAWRVRHVLVEQR